MNQQLTIEEVLQDMEIEKKKQQQAKEPYRNAREELLPWEEENKWKIT